MPYIPKEDRPALDVLIDQLVEILVGDELSDQLPGRLNYVMTRLLVRTLPERRYWALSAWRAIPLDVAAEWYRRVMAPYEWAQQGANGDVYGEAL